ncbi:MAG: hypothetical protein HQ567_14460 [Candidatus Nealsonbacteria bacterium]|nr:hypothetical protein [Candidatus Nealsonbacteria bacterium]
MLLRENSVVSDYNGLFHAELQKLLPKLTDPWRRQDAIAMQTFDFSRYILSSLRNAGFRDQNSLTERLHEITVKLLVSPGRLFASYDETRHGPMSARFKVSMSRLIMNMQAKEANRRKHFSAMPIDMMPAITKPDVGYGEDLIGGFRELIQQRLEPPALQVFDTRLAERPIKDMVGLSSYSVKKAVRQIKRLAMSYARELGDPGFLRQIERLMEKEAATVEKRRA